MRPVAVNASVLQHPSLPYLYLCPKWDTRKEGGRSALFEGFAQLWFLPLCASPTPGAEL